MFRKVFESVLAGHVKVLVGAKAQRDLGYQPLFTTEQALKQCMPYYADLSTG